jgi:DNA-binding GntR family transcriptional regulator
MIIDEMKSPSLEVMVYEKLEEEILTGVLARGTALTEKKLTERLGVSRTPVRAALKRLSEEGLVQSTPNKGAVVIGINMDDLIDIYNIRMRLEGLASFYSAERISEEELKKLRQSVELSEFYIEKRDTENLKELDTAFHSIIYKASGNRLLAKTLSELHKKIKTYRKLSLNSPDRLIMSVSEHREIYEAIRDKNASLADELTSLHIERALENIMKLENK